MTWSDRATETQAPKSLLPRRGAPGSNCTLRSSKRVARSLAYLSHTVLVLAACSWRFPTHAFVLYARRQRNAPAECVNLELLSFCALWLVFLISSNRTHFYFCILLSGRSECAGGANGALGHGVWCGAEYQL
jgi:hypothetical protein